jgi:hypothetical protein
LLPDGTYGVKAGLARYLENIVIPSEYRGKAVTTIMENGFESMPNLKTVTIPDSITTIEASAFKGVVNLTTVTIPDSVLIIGNNSFYSCSGLTNVYGCENVQEYGTGAFKNCTNLSEININNCCTRIGESCFYGDNQLSVTIYPENLTFIGSNSIVSVKELIWKDDSVSSWTFTVKEGQARIWPYIPGDIGQYHYTTVRNQTFNITLNSDTASDKLLSVKEYTTNVEYNYYWGNYKLPVKAASYDLTRK